MKTVKILVMDENGEITRELTMLCAESNDAAKLFNKLTIDAMWLSTMHSGITASNSKGSKISYVIEDEVCDVPLDVWESLESG
jgi:hypothetical protein